MSLKFVIIGAAHPHVWSIIKQALDNPDVELAGIADSNEARCNKIRTTCDCRTFTDWREMLDAIRPEAAASIEIFDKRLEPAIECARRGIHLLADKPVAIRLDELDALEQAAAENPAWLLSAMFTTRFSAEGQTLKKVLDQGIIGKPAAVLACRTCKLGQRRPAWFFERTRYGGILADMGVHDIDLFRWLLGAEIVEVAASSRNVRFNQYPGFSDSAQALLRFSNGVTALLDVNWLGPDAQDGHDSSTILTGSKGVLEHKNDRFTLITNDEKQHDIAVVAPQRSVFGEFVGYCLGKVAFPMIGNAESFRSTRTALLVQQAADENTTLNLKEKREAETQ